MGKRILVVDDEPEILSILQMDLEPFCERVSAACDVPSALEVLARDHVDLVISDVRMPGRGGVDLLLHIKQQHLRARTGLPLTFKNVPDLAFLSAFSDISPDEAFDLGAVGVLSKPYDPIALGALVERTLGEPNRRWEVLGEDVPPIAARIVVDAPGAAVLARWGAGGLFVPGSHGELEIHDEVVVEVPCPGIDGGAPRTSRGLACVRWVRRYPTAVDPEGIGLEWVALDGPLRELLLRFHAAEAPVPFIPRR